MAARKKPDESHQEIERLRAENEILRRALYAAMKEDISFTKDELLAQVVKDVPLDEFLNQMERKYVTGKP